MCSFIAIDTSNTILQHFSANFLITPRIYSTSLSTSKHNLNVYKKKSIIRCRQIEQPECLLPGHGRSAVECVLLYKKNTNQIVFLVSKPIRLETDINIHNYTYEPHHEKICFCIYMRKAKAQISFAVTTHVISIFVFATKIV